MAHAHVFLLDMTKRAYLVSRTRTSLRVVKDTVDWGCSMLNMRWIMMISPIILPFQRLLYTRSAGAIWMVLVWVSLMLRRYRFGTTTSLKVCIVAAMVDENKLTRYRGRYIPRDVEAFSCRRSSAHCHHLD